MNRLVEVATAPVAAAAVLVPAIVKNVRRLSFFIYCTSSIFRPPMARLAFSQLRAIGWKESKWLSSDGLKGIP
jgi:hypothetical protein